MLTSMSARQNVQVQAREEHHQTCGSEFLVKWSSFDVWLQFVGNNGIHVRTCGL